MAENKKISELTQIQSLNNDDEFMVVDKSITSGDDASSTGKTAKVALWQLKDAVSASGPKGDKGDQGNTGPAGPKGSTGSQGVQGATGAKGAAAQAGGPGSKGDQGPTGPKGSTGSQGPTGPTGNSGARGSTGATGTRGPGGQTGAKGATGSAGVNGNANSHMRLTRGPTKHADFDSTGQKLVKSSGGAGWTGSVYSQTAYSNGCYVSFTMHKVVSFMCGLNTDPTKDESYYSIDYAFYPHGSGIQIYQSGAAQKNPATGAYDFGKYVPGVTVFTITYDNQHVRYMLDGVVVHAVNVGPAKRFYMDSSLHTTGQHTNMLAFGPMGQAGAKGNAGATGARGSTGATGGKGSTGSRGATGSTGPRGATGPTGNRGLTGLKGNTGASGVFTGGTVSAPILVNSTAGQQLVLQGANSPYIRFREGTTNKAYIQWNSNGQLYFVNSETGTSSTVANDRFTVNTRFGYVQIGAMNTGHCHFYTDRGSYYFNKGMSVHGPLVDYATKALYYPGKPVFQLGDGASADYKTASSRRVNPHSGNPTNAHYAVSTFGNSGNVTGQLATHFVSGEAYTRGFNSKWSAWRRHLDTTNMKGINGHFARMMTGSSTNNAYFDSKASWGTTHQTANGYIQFGPANSSHAHIYTDRANFYFNKELRVNGAVVYTTANSSNLVKTTGSIITGVTYFNSNALRVKQSMLVLNEKGHTHTYISQDGNGFTRVAGQYGVGFIGRGVQDAGKGVDSAELGRFTSLGNDLKGSSLLKIGCNTTNRPMARLDVGAHGSIFQRNGHYGDAMYLSTGAKFVHDGKNYRWSNSIKGHSCAVALARNGFNIWNSGAIFSPGQAPAYRLDFHMNHIGNLHIRGGYHKLSDIREKKNIKSLDRINSLDKVLKLNPVTFEWKDESIKGEKLGLIAQEVEAVVPNAVEENDTSTPMAGQEPEPSRKSIDYEALIPLLISSIQNQQQQINQLRKQLNSK